MEKKYYIDSTMALREIQDFYSLPKSTAWHAKQKGWFIPAYRNAGRKKKPPLNHLKIARYMCRRWFKPFHEFYPADAQQECHAIALAGKDYRDEKDYFRYVKRELYRSSKAYGCTQAEFNLEERYKNISLDTIRSVTHT